jgi:hypothetical protein
LGLIIEKWGRPLKQFEAASPKTEVCSSLTHLQRRFRLNVTNLKNTKKKKVRTRPHTRTDVISDTERLEIHYWTLGSRVTRFAVCYCCEIDGEWVSITWCDDAHLEKGRYVGKGRKGHCHSFSAQGGKLVENEYLLGLGTPAEHLTEVLNNFKKNHEQIRAQYMKAVEKAARQAKNR